MFTSRLASSSRGSLRLFLRRGGPRSAARARGMALRGGVFAAAGGGVLLALAMPVRSAACEGLVPADGAAGDAAKEGADAVESFLERVAVPAVRQLGFSGVVGFASGVAVKSLGRSVAVYVGAGFIAVQALQHFGYINVNWGRVEDAAKEVLDVNDDGKLDAEDVKIVWRKIRRVLAFGLASATGFSAGLALGVRYG